MQSDYRQNLSQPLVSICLPVFNGEQFLPKAFECFSKQTYTNFEVIVIDDGSTDRSASLARELMATYKLKGSVIESENHGCEQARDLCCHHAGGDIFAPFDADDNWADDYIEAMASVLINHPAVDFVYCDFYEYFQQTGENILKSSTSPWVDLSVAELLSPGLWCFPQRVFLGMLLQGQVVMPPCTVFRRSIYEMVGGYSHRLPSLAISLDWWFGLMVALKGVVAFQSRPLLYKLRYEGNLSGNSVKTARSDVVVMEALLEDEILTLPEQSLASQRASQRALDAAYGLFADEGNNKLARIWLKKSLKHQFEFRALKLFLATLLPSPVIRLLRKRR